MNRLFHFLVMMSMSFFVSGSVRAATNLWKYRDAKGGVHFVNGRENIPAQFRASAMPAQPAGNRSGNLTVRPRASLHAPAVQSQPVQQTNLPQTPPPAADAAVVQVPQETLTQPPGGEVQLGLKLPAQLDFVTKVLPTQKFGNILKLAQDQSFQTHLKAVQDNPNKTYGLGALVVVMLLAFYFRYKINFNTERNFVEYFFLKLAVFIFVVIGSAGVSYFVYGESLKVLALKIWEVMRA